MKVFEVFLAVLFQLFTLGLNAAPPKPNSLPTIIPPQNSTADDLLSSGQHSILKCYKVNQNYLTSPNTIIPTSNSDLPPTNPWTYLVPQTSPDVTFYHLGVEIEENDVFASLLEDETIGMREIAWNTPTVRLILHPESTMTWIMWGASLKTLTHFANSFDSVSFLFDIKDQGKGVGGGQIVLPKPKDSKQNAPATSYNTAVPRTK